MEEESRNDTNIENAIKNEEEAPVETTNVTNPPAAKREYVFDNPEVREEIIKRIGEIFNISVILNFSQRQEDLADILDNVRWELYEVKESIETMSDELKPPKPQKTDQISHISSTNMSTTIKKNASTLNRESISVPSNTNKFPNKSEISKTNKNKLLESKEGDLQEFKTDNYHTTTLKKTVVSKSKLTIEPKESDTKKKNKKDLSVDNVDKIRARKSLNDTAKIKPKEPENDKKRKQDQKTPTKRPVTAVPKTENNLKGKSTLKVVKTDGKVTLDKSVLNKSTLNNKKEPAGDTKIKGKATIVTPVKRDIKTNKKASEEKNSSTKINVVDDKNEKPLIEEIDHKLVESFIENILDKASITAENLESTINENKEEEKNVENESNNNITESEPVKENLENDAA